MVADEREPWDAPVYWQVAYPAALAVGTLLAFLFPQRAWRWVIMLFGAQFLTMCLVNGELGSLSPIGLIAFGVIALPGIVLAKLASRRPRKS